MTPDDLKAARNKRHAEFSYWLRHTVGLPGMMPEWIADRARSNEHEAQAEIMSSERAAAQ